MRADPHHRVGDEPFRLSEATRAESNETVPGASIGILRSTAMGLASLRLANRYCADGLGVSCQARSGLDRISRYFCSRFSWNVLERITVGHERVGARVSRMARRPLASQKQAQAPAGGPLRPVLEACL